MGLAAAPAVTAQQKFQVLGPNECLNCHDHDAEKQWYEKKEIPEVQKLFPDKGANAGHINSLKQLEAMKSNDFAKAIGLADKYDLNGACVRCHAPILCAAQLDQEIDWEEHLFPEVGCSACGWKVGNQPGRKAIQKLPLKWGVIKKELGL